MIVIGLTGSIAMGKTVAAGMFSRCHVPVSDADAIVHRLLSCSGKAVEAIANIFPETEKNGKIIRKKLGDIVFADNSKMRKIENILHPLVRKEHARFIARHMRMRTKAIVLDIPLLFEAGADADCDIIAVVSAPEWVQRQRLLKRKNMTEEKLENILSIQVPDREKRLAADIIIDTGIGKAYSMRQIKRFVKRL